MAAVDSLWNISLVIFLLQILCKEVNSNEPGIQHEVCYLDTFDAQCPHGQVIIIREAQFGRMKIGRCADDDIGCARDVTSYMDSQCSGKRQCEVHCVDRGLVSLSPCSTSKASYLEVTYDCVSVIDGAQYQQQCDTRNGITISHASGGLLSSTQVYRRHNRGAICPYNIEVLPGQILNVTLVDFGVSDMSGSYGSCHEYAEIRESVSSQAVSVCRGRVREKNVFTSRTHRIQIRFSQSQEEENPSSFLLKYGVTGCPDPEVNGNIVLERTHSKTMMYCESTGTKHILMCEDNEWDKYVDICSVSSSWNTGIFVVLGVGILIGMIIGSCVFLSILFCIRKRRELSRRQNTDGYYSTYGPKGDISTYPGHTLPRKSLPSDKQDYMTAGYDKQAARDATLRKPTNHPYEPVR